MQTKQSGEGGVENNVTGILKYDNNETIYMYIYFHANFPQCQCIYATIGATIQDGFIK